MSVFVTLTHWNGGVWQRSDEGVIRGQEGESCAGDEGWGEAMLRRGWNLERALTRRGSGRLQRWNALVIRRWGKEVALLQSWSQDEECVMMLVQARQMGSVGVVIG